MNSKLVIESLWMFSLMFGLWFLISLRYMLWDRVTVFHNEATCSRIPKSSQKHFIAEDTNFSDVIPFKQWQAHISWLHDYYYDHNFYCICQMFRYGMSYTIISLAAPMKYSHMGSFTFITKQQAKVYNGTNISAVRKVQPLHIILSEMLPTVLELKRLQSQTST